MRILFLSVIAAIALAGCAETTQRIVREPYGVPTPMVPHPPKVQRPDFEIDKLPIKRPEDMTEAEKGEYIKAYGITAQQWKQYALLLEPIVAAYEKAATMSDEARKIIEDRIAVLSKEAADIVRNMKVDDAGAKAAEQQP